jgi:5'-3' exonuclease
MEPFDLPTLNGLHLVPGLCDGILTGAEALAGFPSLHTFPHAALLGFHGVNVHGSESRNKSMVVHIKNPWAVLPSYYTFGHSRVGCPRSSTFDDLTYLICRSQTSGHWGVRQGL